MAFRTNLEAYWRFDTDADDNFKSNDGVVTGATHHSSSGKIKGYYNFDGNDRITVADSDDLSFGDGSTDDPFSVSVWLNYPSNPTGACAIIAKGEYEWVYFMDNNKLRIVIFGSGVVSHMLSAKTSSNVGLGAWHHYVCTYDGNGSHTGIKLYQDANSLGLTASETGTYVAMTNTAVQAEIGRWPLVGYYPLVGDLDELCVWRKELTPTEITKLYNSGNGRSLPFVKTNGVYAQKINGVDVANIKKIGGVEW